MSLWCRINHSVNATLALLEKIIIYGGLNIQLKLSHHMSPVPPKGYVPSLPCAPLFLPLSFFVWLSVLQVLQLKCWTWYSGTTLGWYAKQKTVQPETSKRVKRASHFPLGAHIVVPLLLMPIIYRDNI